MIQSFEEACDAKGLNPADLPQVDLLPVRHQKAVIAFYKLTIIAEALNGDYSVNWAKSDQWKHHPWFEIFVDTENPEKVELKIFSVYSYVRSNTPIGGRICFCSADVAKHAANQFTDLFTDLFIIPSTPNQ